MNQPYVKIRSHSLVIVKSSSSSNSGATNDIRMGTKLIEPNAEDMKVVAQILANITDHLYEQPGLAMKVVSNNMGWLYSRNVPL